VENAIKALITRSANDVAVVIGENISGSEEAFAARMTKTARALGMTRTTFRNASGLPNPAQVTTARDMATLGLRIQRDFPRYYPYFNIRSFSYNGRAINTHNRLLGRYRGADGIKTGYIRASGYNLTTSAERSGKRVVGVVMGAKSAGSRNQYMMKMLDKHFAKAKPARRGGTIAALAGQPPGAEPGVLIDFSVAAANAAVPPVSTAPQPQPAPVIAAASSAIPASSGKTIPPASAHEADSSTGIAPASLEAVRPETPAVVSGDGGPEPETSDVGEEEGVAVTEPAAPAAGGTVLAYAAPEPASAVPGVTTETTTKSKRSSWDIQVGAYPKAKDARRRLDEVRALKLSSLREKAGQAIPVSKGKSILYRARFLGFSEKAAKETCRELSRRGVSCLTLGPQS
jgi:D-alanyl-D-alanine carboxypeptidase